MNKHEIEARLERSLRSQVRVPKLDGRFDAGVWARIESAKASAAAPAMPPKSAASKWLLTSNAIGAVITIALVVYFGGHAFTGVEVNAALPVPDVSPGFVERAVMAMVWPVTVLALGVGLMFTSLGRRLRAEYF